MTVQHISSKDITIKWETNDISTQVLGWNGFPIDVLTEEAYGYNDEWVFYETTGIKQMGDLTLSVFFDPTSNSAWDYLNDALGSTGTLRVELGTLAQGGRYKEADVIVASTNISAERGALVKADFTLRLATAVTEGNVT